MAANLIKRASVLSCCTGAYMRYAKKVMPAVLTTFPPRTSAHLVAKTIGTMWSEMSEEQQQPYRDAYQADANLQRSIADKLEVEAVEAKKLRQQQQQEGTSVPSDTQSELPLLSDTQSGISMPSDSALVVDPDAPVKKTRRKRGQLLPEVKVVVVKEVKVRERRVRIPVTKKAKKLKPVPGKNVCTSYANSVLHT